MKQATIVIQRTQADRDGPGTPANQHNVLNQALALTKQHPSWQCVEIWERMTLLGYALACRCA
ncbi:MAG: hypothetical protein JRD89_03460 [Deltaproteobacteria bacterium]|nr:hypothetical protein [Deltaproteobacteria bacterium]